VLRPIDPRIPLELLAMVARRVSDGCICKRMNRAIYTRFISVQKQEISGGRNLKVSQVTPPTPPSDLICILLFRASSPTYEAYKI